MAINTIPLQHLSSIPKEAVKIVLVLFLSFLIGLEREEHMASGGTDHYGFGGVRTFPLLALVGYVLALLSNGSLVLPAVGLVVVGALLTVSYRHKLESANPGGMTTEISGVLIYAVGALVYQEQYWIATTLTVVGVVLLELKSALENMTKRLPADDLLAFMKFLLLTAVILPVVPNETIGPFAFNPFKAWLVVVAVSAISYGSYLLRKILHGHGDVMLSSLLGGMYSSTVETVVLAKRSKSESQPHLFTGAVVLSSGVMYLRLLALLALFSPILLKKLAVPFLGLATLGILGGWAWSMRREPGADVKPSEPPKNPLELGAALLFGLVFAATLAITHYALIYLGSAGFYTLSALMGFSDVTPFVMSLTQSVGTQTPVQLAAAGVVISASSNNVLKGAYAYGFADKQTGRASLALLTLFALVGLVAMAW
jgi:uncharacterized membrane protein (DUF4010 family)